MSSRFIAAQFISISFHALSRLTPLLLFIFLLNTIGYLKAADIVPTAKQSSGTPQISILEGKSFAGELGLSGKPASATDLLIFNNGMFVSKGCERRCGYTAAEYRMRAVGDHFEVISETPCLESDATILWRGTVKGDEIEGTFTWTNRRWYWTFEKEFWFKGKLVKTDAAEND